MFMFLLVAFVFAWISSRTGIIDWKWRNSIELLFLSSKIEISQQTKKKLKITQSERAE